MKLLIIFLFAFVFAGNSHAQIGSWLKKQKDNLTQKANDKANERINNSADNILSKTDSLKIGSGKRKREKAEKETIDSADVSAADSSAVHQTILQTNIKSIAGKEKTESRLKDINGVYNIVTDIKTGELSIEYDMTEKTYNNILKAIKKAGYKASKQ